MLLPWFFAHQVLTFSVFCGIIGIVHSDDPFELMFGYSILLQIRYYGYLFLKTLYCNFILQCAKFIFGFPLLNSEHNCDIIIIMNIKCSNKIFRRTDFA